MSESNWADDFVLIGFEQRHLEFGETNSTATFFLPADARNSLLNRIIRLKHPLDSWPTYPPQGMPAQIVSVCADISCHVRGEPGWAVVNTGLADHDDERLTSAVWNLFTTICTPIPQYRTGELIYPVEVHSGSFLRSSHYSQSRKTGGYHTDGTLLGITPEIAMLAGLSTADKGGETVIIDGYMLIDNLLNNFSHHLAALEQPHPFHSGDSIDDPIMMHKVISRTNERTELRYMRQYIEQGYAQIGQPLSENVAKALDAWDDLAAAPDQQIPILIDRGHLLLWNNFRFLHGRRPFTERHQRRRLRRAYGIHLSTPSGDRGGNP